MSKEIENTKSACLDCGYRIEDHFVDGTDLIEIGKGWERITEWAEGRHVRAEGEASVGRVCRSAAPPNHHYRSASALNCVKARLALALFGLRRRASSKCETAASPRSISTSTVAR